MQRAQVLSRRSSRWWPRSRVALSACSDSEEVPREPFNPPPDQVNKFLGYFTASDKLTACGNCHAEKQADWTTTKHSQAWGDLVASGHQTAECNSCHSVSERGNAAAAPAGTVRSRIPRTRMSSARAATGQASTTRPARRSRTGRSRPSRVH